MSIHTPTAEEITAPERRPFVGEALQSRIVKIARWILVAAGLIMVAIALRLTVLAPKPVPVRTAAVERGVVEQTVTNTRAGTVMVRRRASLSPQIGGLVVELPHLEGSRVAAGEVLLRLDDQAPRAELELARRSVATAEAQASEACLASELAVKELARTTALHGQGIASDQNLDVLSTDSERSAAACAAARAAVAQAHAQVSLAEVQLRFTELRAPFAGVVADVSTEVGEWITPSPPGVPIPPVIDLLDPASVYISAPIDEVDAERIGADQPVRITVDSRPEQSFGGRVARVAPYVLDNLEQNRTVEVEAEFTDTAVVGGLLPGTSADVEIILQRRDDVLRLPAAAVASGGKVLVLVDGVLCERTIVPGLGNWQWIEVIEGVVEGEVVAVSRDNTNIRAGALAVERVDE